jgi:hypothetical protein
MQGVGRADRWMHCSVVEWAGVSWVRPSRCRQGSSSRPAPSRHRRSTETRPASGQRCWRRQRPLVHALQAKAAEGVAPPRLRSGGGLGQGLARRRGAGAAPLDARGDDGVMEVLSSRVLLRPTDPERSRAFYRDILGLAVSREFGSGPEQGTVFFVGGGLLEVSGRAAVAPASGMALWLRCASWRRFGGSWASVACGSCGSRPGSRGGCWRCGSPTRTGSASAWWRCRRSIRCAEETEQRWEVCLAAGMVG